MVHKGIEQGMKRVPVSNEKESRGENYSHTCMCRMQKKELYDNQEQADYAG